MSVDAPETGESTESYEEALEAGYWGTHQDPEPNETYTLQGQASEPPPEQTTSSASGKSTGKPASSKASDSS